VLRLRDAAVVDEGAYALAELRRLSRQGSLRGRLQQLSDRRALSLAGGDERIDQPGT
jgi:hypothetical protein